MWSSSLLGVPMRIMLQVSTWNSSNDYYCDTCDRGFKLVDKYNQHISEHETCQVEGCSYVAAPKLVNLHYNMVNVCYSSNSFLNFPVMLTIQLITVQALIRVPSLPLLPPALKFDKHYHYASFLSIQQHLTGLAKKIKESDEDIKKWIEERKRFA